MSERNESLDLLGIQPISDSIKIATQKSFEGIESFLRATCMPAFEEVGFMLKDQVRSWRLANILRILNAAKGKLEFTDDGLKLLAHPRVGFQIIEYGSMVDDDELQNMWAGLFASSCTKSGRDDQNLIFVDLLKQLTSLEARIIKYACENCRKVLFKSGLVNAGNLYISFDELVRITEVNDIHRLDRELDHLRSIELIGHGLGSGGFDADSINPGADITPTALTLNLYLKTNGYQLHAAEYWKKVLISPEENQLIINAQANSDIRNFDPQAGNG